MRAFLRKTRIVVAVVVLAAAAPLHAQDARGRIQGSIVDTTGGVLPGVSVTLANDATAVAVTRVSGANGRYQFEQIDPGTYTLTAALSGFATVVQKNVRVAQRGDVTADLTLRVSDLAETVTVERSPVEVQFNTASRDMTVQQQFINELPLAQRNPATLAQLDPSVNGDYTRTANFDHYAANAYDIGGRSAGQNDILIDGSPLTNSAKLAYNPPVDAVAEYTLLQNAVDAEYGHSAGGIVSMSMKSGSNTIHGSAYYYGGDPSWNAVTNRVTQQRSQNTYWNAGGTVGLPLKKNKLFLFSAFEKQTDTSYRALSYTLPTALERQGDFSQSLNANGTPRIIYDPLTSRNVNGVIVRDPFPGNVIPKERWDALATRMLQNLWTANNAGDNLTGLNNYKYDDYRYYRYYNSSNRVDWQINDRWKVFGRVSFFKTDQPANDYTNGTDTLKMRRTEGSERNGLNIAADTIYTISPSTLLNVSGSYYQTVDRRNYPEMAIGEAGYEDLWPSGWFQPYMSGRPLVYFPNINVAPNSDAFGVRNFWWQQPDGSSLAAKLTKNFANHTVKLGTNVRLKRGDAARFFFANLLFDQGFTQNTTSGANANTGNPWASFLLGAMNPGGPSSVQFIPLQQANTEMYAMYVQDDYRVTGNLTLNLGLRYEYEGGYWDSENRLPQRLDLTDPIPGMQANIEPQIPASIKTIMAQSAGQNSYLFNGAYYFTEDGNNRATQSDSLELMPRLGLAYRFDDNTSIRVGYGRFYTPSALTDSGNEPLGMLDLGSFSPTTNVLPAQQGVPQAYLSNPFPQGLTLPYGKSYGRYSSLGDSITIDEYERRPPISDRINLSVQRQIWARTIVDVTYLMNFTSRDLLNVNLNMADPRLAFQYRANLGVQVANPFFNYGTEETFPGALRRQPTVATSQLLRPYPQYGDIVVTSADLGEYRYQSLQLRAQRSFYNGVSFLATYAYNREQSQVFYDDQDQYDRALTWQDTPNPRHRLVAAATIEIPYGRNRKYGSDLNQVLDLLLGGWQVSGVYTYRSGTYLRFGAMVAPENVTKLGGTGRENYWFDTTGFSVLPAFTRRANPWQYDNLTGPIYSNLDAVLSKRFELPGTSTFEFRLEAYNALNQIIWTNPNVTVGASDFGRSINQANAGRRLQLALRLQF